MPPLNVTIVAHDVGTSGGMEGQLGILTQGLLDAGVRVTVITRRCGLTAHPLLTVRRVRTPRRPFPLGYPLFALAGSWALRRHRSGIVHATGAIVIPAVDCVTVHFCHAAYRDLGGGSRPSGPGRLRQLSAHTSGKMAIFAEHWCYRPSRARSVIAVSAGVGEEMRQHFPALADRLQVIPHGVDSERFKPNPVARRSVRAQHGLAADDLVAVFVGGDWKRKRLALAIDAIAQTDRWKLLVVGSGHRPAYEQRARDRAVAGRVCFAGPTDDVPAYLAAGDVFLLPTEYETFCLVAFEAAAVGLPVLVSRVSGPDMLVEPGVNGEFVDDDAGRTARLLSAYSDRQRRVAHGEAARARARSFTWDQATAAHRALYQRLTSTDHNSAS
jgi:UDP-glucose:(heptosyl)LPS alpha-1,3-glucosyltransferase